LTIAQCFTREVINCPQNTGKSTAGASTPTAGASTPRAGASTPSEEA